MVDETKTATGAAAAATEGADADPDAEARREFAAATSGAAADQEPTVEARLKTLEEAKTASEERATVAETRAQNAETRATAAEASVGPEVDRRLGQALATQHRKESRTRLDDLRTRAAEGDTAALDEMHRLGADAMEQPDRDAAAQAQVANVSTAHTQALQQRMYGIFLPRVKALEPTPEEDTEYVRIFNEGRYEDLDVKLREAETAKNGTPAPKPESKVANEREAVVAARANAGADMGGGPPSGGTPAGDPAENASLDDLFAVEGKRLQGIKR